MPTLDCRFLRSLLKKDVSKNRLQHRGSAHQHQSIPSIMLSSPRMRLVLRQCGRASRYENLAEASTTRCPSGPDHSSVGLKILLLDPFQNNPHKATIRASIFRTWSDILVSRTSFTTQSHACRGTDPLASRIWRRKIASAYPYRRWWRKRHLPATRRTPSNH